MTGQQDNNIVVARTCCHFDLCITFVACGAYFRMVSCLIDCKKMNLVFLYLVDVVML